jgi:hypothetical protein
LILKKRENNTAKERKKRAREKVYKLKLEVSPQREETIFLL